MSACRKRILKTSVAPVICPIILHIISRLQDLLCLLTSCFRLDKYFCRNGRDIILAYHSIYAHSRNVFGKIYLVRFSNYDITVNTCNIGLSLAPFPYMGVNLAFPPESKTLFIVSLKGILPRDHLELFLYMSSSSCLLSTQDGSTRQRLPFSLSILSESLENSCTLVFLFFFWHLRKQFKVLNHILS